MLEHRAANKLAVLKDGDRYRALELAFRALRNGNRELVDVPDTEEVRYLRAFVSEKSRYGHYGFLTRRS